MPMSVSDGLEQRHDGVGDERVERLDVVGHARDQHAGGPALVEADRHLLQVAEDLQAQVLQRALADPADEVGLRVGRRPDDERADEERDDDEVERGDVALRGCRVDRRLGQRRGRQRRAPCRRPARRTSATTRAAVGPQQHDQPAQLAPAAARCRAGAGAGRRGAWRARAASAPASQARHLALARLAREEDLVGQALLDDLAVQLGLLEQLVVACRAAAIRAVLEHDDLVGQRDRRQAVGDDERRAARHDLAQRGLDLLLGRGVDGRRRVVEDRGSAGRRERARDRDALALAAAEASARARRCACRSRRAARSMKSCACARRAAQLDLLARRVRRARRRCSRATVAENRNGSSSTTAIARAQRGEVDVAHVGAVDEHRARGRRRTGAGAAATSVVLPEPVAPTSATVRARRRRRGRRRAAPGRAAPS